jgi:hypothetical protein
MLIVPSFYILMLYVLSIQFYGFALAWNEGLYAQPVSFLVPLMRPSSDGAAHIIIRLELPSEDRGTKR